MTWRHGMKIDYIRQVFVRLTRLAGWEPGDGTTNWLEMLRDMDQNRKQKNSCSSFLLHSLKL